MSGIKCICDKCGDSKFGHRAYACGVIHKGQVLCTSCYEAVCLAQFGGTQEEGWAAQILFPDRLDSPTPCPDGYEIQDWMAEDHPEEFQAIYGCDTCCLTGVVCDKWREVLDDDGNCKSCREPEDEDPCAPEEVYSSSSSAPAQEK